MSEELSEFWKDHRQAQQERRAERLPIRTNQILALRKMGFKVEQKTEYQYRINGYLDIYPIHNRYHDIKLNKRGGFRNVISFVKGYVETKS